MKVYISTINFSKPGQNVKSLGQQVTLTNELVITNIPATVGKLTNVCGVLQQCLSATELQRYSE